LCPSFGNPWETMLADATMHALPSTTLGSCSLGAFATGPPVRLVESPASSIASPADHEPITRAP